MIRLAAIAGPTASGKTGLAVYLAENFGGEVLSFDSMQLYRGMDIATAKPTPEEMRGIPHHMIDCVDPSERFSVVRYKEEADRIIREITERGNLPVMVGGTGLYMDSVLENINFLDAGENPEIRERLERELSEKGPEDLYLRLKEIDPESAERIHMNNTGRVIRALEIYESTGRTMTEQRELSRREPSPYDPFYIGITARDRSLLYERTDKRIDMMLEKGLLSEALEFPESEPGRTAFQAIGIKEMLPYIRGEKTLEECTERLKQATRNYAKRQLTWFRKNGKINWLYLEDYDSPEAMHEAAAVMLEEAGFRRKTKR